MRTNICLFALLFVLTGCGTLMTFTDLKFRAAESTVETVLPGFTTALEKFVIEKNGFCKKIGEIAFSCVYSADAGIVISYNLEDLPMFNVRILSDQVFLFPSRKSRLLDGSLVPENHHQADRFVMQSLSELQLVSAFRSYAGTGVSLDILTELCGDCEKP